MHFEIVEQTDKAIVVMAKNNHNEFGIDILWLEVIDKWFESLLESVSPLPARVIFDISNITWFDSSSLRQLVYHSTDLHKIGTEFFLSGANEHILRILEITRLNDKLKILDNDSGI